MEKPIRILHVLGRLDRGGAESMVMNLYRNIDRNKIQFDFVKHTQEKCDFDDEINQLGGSIYTIVRYNGKNHNTYLNSWKKLFNEHPEFVVVHGHVRSTASLYLKIAKDFGIITIAHSHSIASRGSFVERIVKNTFQFQIRYLADYMLACTYDAGKWLFGKNSLKKENFKIIRNAIRLEEFIFNKSKRIEIRDILKLENSFVLGHIGSFTAPKNHEFIIQVFDEIHSKIPNVKLLLVGDGYLKKSIERQINRLGLEDNILCVGNVVNPNDYLQAMDLFLFPSLYEGFGMAAIEAQVSGLMTLVSERVPEEIFVSSNSKCISINNKERWVQEIYKFYIKGFNEKNRYVEIRKFKEYDIDVNSRLIEKFYQNIIRNKGE